MTVDVDNECPFCGTSLTYEPNCDAAREKIVWNKYYLLYMAKNIWFSLLCGLIGVVRLMIARPPMSELLVVAIVCVFVSLLIALFQRPLSKGNWVYKESYIPIILASWKYGAGLLAVLFFLFIK